MAVASSSYYTEESRWLMEQLLTLAPGTLNGGIYANKPGYHNTGNNLLQSWPNDYSIRDAEDRRGEFWRTKAAGYDWTFPEAQQGDYRRIVQFGVRLRAAFDARDPRLNGWREALGQTDLDATPEGLDFRYGTTRTPNSTHAWHFHFSEDRELVGSLDNKKKLLSVLRGESYLDWIGDDGMSAEEVWAYMIGSPALGISRTAGDWLKRIELTLSEVKATRSEVAALQQVIKDMGAVIAAGGGNVDTAAILAGVAQLLEQQRADINADTRDAVGDAQQGGADAVRAGG